MNALTPKLKNIEADKDRFDAILQRIAGSKPLPAEDLKGTFPKMSSQRHKKEPAGSPANDLTLNVAANRTKRADPS